MGEGANASSTATWHYRDELQQRLVRQVRRLPYEVPAFYAADKFIAKPVFGGAEKDNGPKKKWYDPTRGIDVAKDLAKTTLFQLGGFVIPTAAAGAAKESSLNFFRTAEQRLLDTTNRTAYSTLVKGQAKHQIYEKSLNLKGILQEVGHDLFSVLDKSIKFSERSTGALSSAFLAFNNSEKNPVANLYRQRRGINSGTTAPPSRSETIQNLARDIYKGDKRALNRIPSSSSAAGSGSVQGTKIDSLLDLIPGYKSVAAAARTGRDQYRQLSLAQSILDNPTAANVNRVRHGFKSILGSGKTNAEIDTALGDSILNIQRKRSSDLFNILSDFDKKVGIEESSKGFMDLLRRTQYKKFLQQNLIDQGLNKTTAEKFTRQLEITEDVFKRFGRGQYQTTEYIKPTERFLIGKDPISENFYDELITRFNTGKIGRSSSIPSSFNGDALRSAIEKTDELYLHKNNRLGLNLGLNLASARKELRDDFSRKLTTSVLSEQKLNRVNFLQQAEGSGSGAVILREQMAKKAGKVFGLNEEVLNDTAQLRTALSARGIDINNAAQLRGYLINNKQMTRTEISGIAGLFGLRGLTLDEFLAKEKKVYGGIPSGTASVEEAKRNVLFNSPERSFLQHIIANTTDVDTLSTVKGYYAAGARKVGSSGEALVDNLQIVNLNPLKSGLRKIAEFASNEIRVPLINLNPLQMVGIKDFSSMAKAGRYQVLSGEGGHPFIGQSTGADLYSWMSTGGIFGTKGTVTAFARNAQGRYQQDALAGLYRPLSTTASTMFTSTAELAAGEVAPRTTGATTLAGRLKERLNYSEEQQNSLFRFTGRLVNRQADINNPAVMERILGSNLDEEFTIGGFGRRRSLKLTAQKTSSGEIAQYSLIDAKTGTQVGAHGELMEAFTRFANKQLSYGTNKEVIRRTLAADQSLAGDLGLSADDILNISSPAQAKKIQLAVSSHLEGLKGSLKTGSISLDQYQNVSKASKRLNSFLDISDFSAQSQMFEKSSSIVTRGDEFSSEIFRFLLENKAILSGDQLNVMKNVTSLIDDLASKGIITGAQKAEAQASALSTVFNLTAFKTYQYGNALRELPAPFSNILVNPLQRFTETRNVLSDDVIKNLLNPYQKGDISLTGSSSLNPISRITPFFKKNLGMGSYVEKAKPSSLEGGDAFTLIPTFTTAFRNNPKAATLSALGIKTYGNTEGFSLASVPMSHGFNRLNRYFGTVGAQLDTDRFHGPLDMYFRGMNAQRVLPAVAIGSAAFTADRTLGGYTQPKDERGERVYSPLFAGAAARVLVEGQALASGIVPGGMSYGQKREQLVSGEVPIRKGRFWPLGNTPFKGGKIEYFRPSWYRRLQGGAMFTSDTYGSPMEKFLYYNDFSPLRPIDPYRFERKHYEDRPYPVTGEYFSGPFGAAVPILNATVGRILKPQKAMHVAETQRALSSYVPVGDSGAYLPQEQPGSFFYDRQKDPTVSYPAAPVIGYQRKPLRFISPLSDYAQSVSNSPTGYYGSSGFGSISEKNSILISRAKSLETAKRSVRELTGQQNDSLAAAAFVPSQSFGAAPITYGPPTGPGIMSERIVAAGMPIRSGSNQFLSGETGYRLQETFGIYGFAGGNIRSALGLGSYDFEPDKSVLQSASKAYGTTRAFWDLNLGGLGDVPLQAEGALGNIELSEVVRRFIPKERTNVNYINPIKNTMGEKYPFLPNSSYFTDFTTGDPFTRVKEGELRLPGVGYERFNKLYPDDNGRYGAVNQLDILADVAPYSKEFRSLNSQIEKMGLSEEERSKVGQIRAQINAIENSKTNFSTYRDESLFGQISNPIQSLRHIDNPIVNKFFGESTPTEDWERKNVYGSTFPEWQRPVESFIKPIYYKGTQRNPILAAGIGAFALGMFGKTNRAQAILGTIGAVTVGGYSAIQKTKEERFIPLQRKKELALEEYVDILNYVKNRTAAARAERIGDVESAKQFMLASKKTMYGADLNSKSIDTLAAAIPKRKRDHFRAMIEAPEEERGRILSTAGRLERRIYEAAWGMKVERKPDLVNYFTRHELPDANWEGWHPNTNMEHVKIKIGQSMGLEMSQMGYYPQQVKEANLVNPSYPLFGASNDNPKDIRGKLQRLMFDMGINGNITPVSNSSNPNSVNIMAGVR